MNQAINAYYTITASSEFRERERLFDKARHDEAQALRHAKKVGHEEGRAEGKIEIARNGLRLSLPTDTIQQLTGLSAEEIEELRRKL